MKIIFSSHALDRCKEAHISPNSIRGQIKDLPDFHLSLGWSIDQGIVMLKKLSKNKALVVTVLSKHRAGDKQFKNKQCLAYLR